ncbi:hypothetical protein AGROH133_07695 [Agrobacterium tumefaciens]|nr:hypothetical protein AGROH133_07695 [Agrobacterium tumefaciens]
MFRGKIVPPHSKFCPETEGNRQLFHQLSNMRKKCATTRRNSTAGFYPTKSP